MPKEQLLPVLLQPTNIDEGRLWSSNSFHDSSIILELKVPINEQNQNDLHISKVLFGLPEKVNINLLDSAGIGHFNTSSPCNINILCSQGNPWINERQAVCLIETDDGSACSGALLNNTCNFNKPYVLTAWHCTNGKNPNNWTYSFGWWSATCTPNTYNQQFLLFNGATLRATYEPTDFSLLELFQIPSSTSGLTYLGWSRSSVAPGTSVGIHHPMDDQMKICFANNPATLGSIRLNNNTAWRVLWNSGTTEEGSSGSPLFNQDHRVVGQNFSETQPTYPPCNQQTGGNNYGRFDLSWTGGGTNATRLSNWLDPSNSGAITTNTTNIANLFTAPVEGSFLPITGNGVVCGTTQTYTITGVVPGATVVWVLTGPTAGSYTVPLQNVCTLIANGTQATLTKVNTGNVHLGATITNCNGVIQYAGKDIAFGVPPIYYNGGYWTNSHYQPICCTGDPTNATYVPVLLVSSNNQYTWQKTGGSSNATWSQSTNWSANITFSSPVNPGNFIQYNITTANSCGSRSDPVYISYNGSPMFAISPNPVSSELNIESVVINDIYDKKDNSQNYSGIDKVQVIDKMGNVVLRKSYQGNTKKVNLNVSSLHSDVYIIRVFNGKASEEHKIIVQH